MELVGLAILLVFALAIVIFLTRGVFARDLTMALKRVNQQEQALQEKAMILEQRIGQMEQDYHAKVKRAQAEAERLVEDAKQQAMNVRTAAIEEAKHRARQLLLEVEQGRARLKSEISKELNGKAIQRACESLRALLPTDSLTAFHDTLVNELLEALKRLDVGSFKADVIRVDLVTARPLSSAASQQLAQWVVATFGPTIPLHLETKPALVAGGIVRLGSTMLDNSLVNRLGQS